MTERLAMPVWTRWAYALAMAALAVSGFGQLPIFKRYYIADVPGLAWTADYYLTHKLHYAAAVVLLLVLGLALGRYLAAWRRRYALTASGRWRAAGLAALAVTGGMRVLKNLPHWSWNAELTKYLDWTHLGLAVLFLGLVLWAALARRPYLVRR